MDVVLPIFMKNCASRSIEGIVDIPSLKIMLKRWSCNLMTGEWHRLTGVKRSYSVVLMGQVLLKVCVCLCAIWHSCSCTVHSIRLSSVLKVRGWTCSHCFLEYFLRCPHEERGKGGLTCKELLMLLLSLSIYLRVFKVALSLFLFPG